MTTKPLYSLSVQELHAAYAAKELSPVEVARSVNERIAAYEPELRATWLFRPELALEQARASEARWLAGKPRGTLDGVPVTIKDNLATEGDPMPLGTAAYEPA